MPPPDPTKIYHIIHVDRLPSVLAAGCLLCDAEMVNRPASGTGIGMDEIKLRRLNELTLTSHPGLYVGQCVPFYFCPRSVMLYVIWQANHPKLRYRGGEGPSYTSSPTCAKRCVGLRVHGTGGRSHCRTPVLTVSRTVTRSTH